MNDESARDPFGAYHRTKGWMSLARSTAVLAASAALVLGLSLVASGAPPYAGQPANGSAAGPASVGFVAASASRASVESVEVDGQAAGASGAAAPGTGSPGVLPSPSGSGSAAAPVATAPPLATTGGSTWSITIGATGYQTEIDQCQWVRMELGASAPIVGAHNYCGGGIVLDMQLGDTVTLTGTGLGGTYRVTDSRDAHAGDHADAATAGLVADVILQTCYFTPDGRERLVALTR